MCLMLTLRRLRRPRKRSLINNWKESHGEEVRVGCLSVTFVALNITESKTNNTNSSFNEHSTRRAPPSGCYQEAPGGIKHRKTLGLLAI